MSGLLPERADSWKALGLQLQKFRLGTSMTLRTAGAACKVSGSSLHRFETARTRVRPEVAHALDELYATKGWILDSVSALRHTEWVWQRADTPRSRWTHTWHEDVDGQVWLSVLPSRKTAGRDHTVDLAWGKWQHRKALVVPMEGVLLVTGKDRDRGEPPMMEVLIDPPAVVMFGVHGPPTSSSAPTVDIRVGWQLRI